MAHDYLKSETGRATTKMVATLLGGVLILMSFVAGWLFSDKAIDGAQGAGNFYAGLLAGIGALLLAVPLWYHAAKCLFGGHLHMDELVSLAILAAMAMGEYQTAGVVRLLSADQQSDRDPDRALGARAAIQGLIRLTPTKARRQRPEGGRGGGRSPRPQTRRHRAGSPRRQHPRRRPDHLRPFNHQRGQHHRRVTAGGEERGGGRFRWNQQRDRCPVGPA